MRTFFVAIGMAVLSPTMASGQLVELLQALSGGGSWINLEIVAGAGRFSSPVIPIAGMAVEGCFQVWDGHSGDWTVEARDPLSEQELSATVRPGEAVPFDYAGGMTAKLEVDIAWSEPRDTTLFMWVGLKSLTAADQDVCTPS